MGELSHLSSGTHWGVFLGISGPLALVGLTAVFRNVKGSLNNKKSLNLVQAGLQQDINSYKEQLTSRSGEERENMQGGVEKLEAFNNNLKYSQFDTNFNLFVPGVINGVASSIVLQLS